MSNTIKHSIASIPPSDRPAETGSAPAKSTYGQILKASAMIGASSVANIAISVVRTKAMAMFLGPAGFGLMGLYNSIVDFARSVAGMGINSSGVRQIAEAAASLESERIARTAIALRRISVYLGLLGGALLIVFCVPVSVLTFGSGEKAGAVAILATALFIRLLADGQGALLAGMRRMADLAKMWVLGGILGTLVSILLVWLFGERGIVPSVVAVAATSLGMSWWYSRRIVIQQVEVTGSEVRTEIWALLKLGLAFMASGMLTTGAAYAVRAIVIREIGLDAAGYYQSAWAMGGLYVGMILQSMGADFYPRLTGVAKNSGECNRMVNEQALVSLLMAGPGVIATLTFAPLVIAVFYTSEFSAAVDVLRWICLGMTLRVVAWPMGYIVLAKGAQAIFFWTELVATIVHVGLAWLLVRTFGLKGSGMAFCGLYVWHGILIHYVVRRMTGFRWSPENFRTGTVFLSLIGVTFVCLVQLPFWIGTAIGTLGTLVTGIYSTRLLCRLIPTDKIPQLARRWLVTFRFLPAKGSN